MDSSENIRSILSLIDISTGFQLSGNKSKVLHSSINLDIGKGQLIALLGPNGAGKSTLIKTISGIIPPLNGKIMIGEKELMHMSNREIACEISLLLTDKIDDIYLTAFDIVKTGRYPYGSFMGKLSSDDKEIIDESMHTVGINHLYHRVFSTLSDGEKQKVLIARAIAQNTSLIIMDEPTAFIDSPGKIEIMAILTDLVKKHNKSIVITTHDIEMALQNAATLWMLGYKNEFVSGSTSEMVNGEYVNKFFDRDGVRFNKESLKFEKIF